MATIPITRERANQLLERLMEMQARENDILDAFTDSAEMTRESVQNQEALKLVMVLAKELLQYSRLTITLTNP